MIQPGVVCPNKETATNCNSVADCVMESRAALAVANSGKAPDLVEERNAPKPKRARALTYGRRRG